MESKKYLWILIGSLVLLLLEFIIKLKGALGLIISLVSVYLIIGCIIRLIRLARIFDDELMEKLDILFFL